jgi:hypothetical protein
MNKNIALLSTLLQSSFGGLSVSMLASGTQDRGFAPCRRFVACQRSSKLQAKLFGLFSPISLPR